MAILKLQAAKPMQATVSIGIYGPAGSGKSFTSLLFAEGLAKARGKRIAYFSTEPGGVDFYAVDRPPRPGMIHPEKFEFDLVVTRSLADVLETVRALDPKEYGVVVVDSLSHLWKAAIEAYEGRHTKADTIPMQAWGKIKKPYKDLIDLLIFGGAFDAIICGRQKDAWEDDGDGKLKKIGVKMSAEGETEYEPNLLLRMESQYRGRKGEGEGINIAYVEKDRSQILSGRTLQRPTFETIAPILGLLSTESRPMETDEERIAKDGELLDREDEKAKAKADKSRALFSEFQASLLKADSLALLAAAAGEIKKQNRYLVEDHRKALLTVYEERRRVLVEAAVPETI